MKKRRKQLERLFNEQFELCWWCARKMVLMPEGYVTKAKDPRNRATIEHLDDKWSNQRGAYTHLSVRRHVAACWECNNKRGTESVLRKMVDNPSMVWRKSGSFPLLFIDIWEGCANRKRNGWRAS